MSLCLVLHDLPAGGTEILEAAIWEVSESHWLPTPDALLVATEVSVGYLASHLRQALRRHGLEGPMVVLRTGPEMVADGLPDRAAAWLHEQSAAEAPAPLLDA